MSSNNVLSVCFLLIRPPAKCTILCENESFGEGGYILCVCLKLEQLSFQLNGESDGESSSPCGPRYDVQCGLIDSRRRFIVVVARSLCIEINKQKKWINCLISNKLYESWCYDWLAWHWSNESRVTVIRISTCTSAKMNAFVASYLTIAWQRLFFIVIPLATQRIWSEYVQYHSKNKKHRHHCKITAIVCRRTASS